MFYSVLKVRVVDVKTTKQVYKYKLKVEKVLKGNKAYTGKTVSDPTRNNTCVILQLIRLILILIYCD